MIQGNETISEYENFNKIYIPQSLYNDNNKYTISGDVLTIISNNNCTTQYNTTYCDCTYYNIKYNLIMNSTQCNRNPSTNNLIQNEYISTDINYSDRVTQYFKDNYIIIGGQLILALIFVIMLKKSGYKVN